MPVYSVSHSLTALSEGFLEDLLGSKGWCHFIDTTWFIETDETAELLSNRLGKHLEEKGQFLFVMRVSEGYAGWLPKDAWDWLKERTGKQASQMAPVPEPAPAPSQTHQEGPPGPREASDTTPPAKTRSF